jgi:hypothetical protein
VVEVVSCLAYESTLMLGGFIVISLNGGAVKEEPPLTVLGSVKSGNILTW